MRFLLLAIVVYLAAVLQTSLVDCVQIGQSTPDLFLLVAMVWLLAGTGHYGFLEAGLVGLAADLVSPGRLGDGAAWLLAVGYALSRIKARIGLTHWTTQVPALALATTVWVAAMGLTRWLSGEVPIGPLAIVQRALGVGLYTGAVGFPLLLTLGWMGAPSDFRFWIVDLRSRAERGTPRHLFLDPKSQI
jgi:rod shape-determining protein MreD